MLADVSVLPSLPYPPESRSYLKPLRPLSCRIQLLMRRVLTLAKKLLSLEFREQHPWPRWFFNKRAKICAMVAWVKPRYRWTCLRYLSNMYQDPGTWHRSHSTTVHQMASSQSLHISESLGSYGEAMLSSGTSTVQRRRLATFISESRPAAGSRSAAIVNVKRRWCWSTWCPNS